MDETIQPRRQPLVPGPQQAPSISERAIQLREQRHDVVNKLPEPPVNSPRAIWPTPIGNIAKAIAGVMREVGVVNKGGVNRFHNYRYARMEDVLQVVTPLMGKNGLAVIQNEIEIKMEGKRIAVTYEFSIIHESGEVWPERPRFTGLANAFDSKGNLDDKAINKCHTAARKYFLLALFQVPTEYDDDADAGPATKSQRQEAVPGPQPPDKEPPERASEHVMKADPHKIPAAPGTTADVWTRSYLRAIEAAKTPEELKEWDALNDAFLQRVSDSYPSIYEMISAATQRRSHDLGVKRAPVPPPEPKDLMPDPRVDVHHALNWVGTQLLMFKQYNAAEAFWNEVVAPREVDFDQLDWEILMAEWRRTEARLAPDGELDAGY